MKSSRLGVGMSNHHRFFALFVSTVVIMLALLFLSINKAYPTVTESESGNHVTVTMTEAQYEKMKQGKTPRYYHVAEHNRTAANKKPEWIHWKPNVYSGWFSVAPNQSTPKPH